MLEAESQVRRYASHLKIETCQQPFQHPHPLYHTFLKPCKIIVFKLIKTFTIFPAQKSIKHVGNRIITTPQRME